MAPNDILKNLLSGKLPENIRSAIARGIAPLSPEDACRAQVFLAGDPVREIAASAKKTLSNLDEEEVIVQLRCKDCDPAVLEYFGITSGSDAVLQAIIANPSTPGSLIESLSLTLHPQMLAAVLDNRVRILEHPSILNNVKLNPQATPDIQRLVQEIETEFFGDKKREYTIEQPLQEKPAGSNIPDLELEIPPEDLSLEGLPLDDETRNAVFGERLAALSFRDKIRYALFGTREIRALMIRDTNKEISRMVLRSPKITEAEIESFSAMRGVGDEILREIGNSKEFTKSYNVVHNLVRNPKTPPAISQRLIFRLRTQHLSMLARDRSVPDAVRFNATRTLNQRSKQGSR
ncbi:MAG: hypothetical protein JW793_01465 [Acidobacteria bacterium]|nr:hypothetical protein [Acidobacteriota bacterium]